MNKRHLTACAVASLVSGFNSFAADHLDAPSLSGNGQQDINDIFAFQSPTNPDNSVLILTVNPGAGAISPNEFGTTTDYRLLIDNDGDTVPDVTYQANFAGTGAAQTVNLTRNGVLQASGLTGTALPVAGGGQFQTGVFDDPFFFDLDGFNDDFNFTGDDFFAGLDVNAVILEIPSVQLNGATTAISVHATTNNSSDGSQVDRMGRPAITTALLVNDADKEAFNLGSPGDDFSVFGDTVQARIEALNGGDAASAATVTEALLPDVLTFDTSDAGGFLNGRQLADDVIDAELSLLTDGALTTDMVDNDSAFSDTFPFLAPANVPEPSSALLLAGAFAAGMSRRARRA